jgi:hypothetical protein
VFTFKSNNTNLNELNISRAQTAEIRSTLYPENWRPGYKDPEGRFLQDFSYAGYHAGEKKIPDQPSGQIYDVTKSPYSADKTGRTNSTTAIQAAINAAESAGGGIVFFPAGTYSLQHQTGKAYALRVSKSNIVLKGENSDTTKIFLNSSVSRSKSIIEVSPENDTNWKSSTGTSVNYLSSNAEVASTTIPLSTTPQFKVGDLIVLTHDDTPAWISEHGMTAYWYNGAETPTYLRKVTSVNTEQKTITIDTPLRYYLKTRDKARVYKAGPHLQEVGIEALSFGMKESTKSGLGESDYDNSGTAGYDLASSNVIRLEHVQNSWIKKVKSYKPVSNTHTDAWIGGSIHIHSNGIELSQTRQVTITESNFQNAQYRGGDGNGHFYQIEGNDNLISYSSGANGRHNYSIKGAVSSGNVLLSNYSGKGWHMSDFHTKLSQANLVDNHTLDGDGFEARNRYANGSTGSKHGITSTQTVFWNINGQKLYARRNLDGRIVDYSVHSDQHGYGYIIGTRGNITKVFTPLVQQSQSPVDFTEAIGSGSRLNPQSLYLDQLERRMKSSQYPHLLQLLHRYQQALYCKTVYRESILTTKHFQGIPLNVSILLLILTGNTARQSLV